jgi:hypothetical protein
MNMLASVTDWMTAISTTVIGVLGVLLTVMQWRGSGFRPRFAAFLDAPREAIEVDIENHGRGSGVVHQVRVVDRDGFVVEAVTVKGFEDGRFEPTYLPAMGAMRLIVLAPKPRKFTMDHRVMIDLGRREKELGLEPVEVSFYSLRSVLPPGA